MGRVSASAPARGVPPKCGVGCGPVQEERGEDRADYPACRSNTEADARPRELLLTNCGGLRAAQSA
jgi:hypothetical protein